MPCAFSTAGAAQIRQNGPEFRRFCQSKGLAREGPGGKVPTMTSDNWIALSPQALEVNRAVQFVTTAEAGAVAVFLGTTRAETNAAGQPLVALEYEAYAEMATQQLHDLARRARGRGPALKLALLHRIGRVAVGEPSVVIAVSTPHRGDAFALCQWLIDALKAEAAIWKREIWADGSRSWVTPRDFRDTLPK